MKYLLATLLLFTACTKKNENTPAAESTGSSTFKVGLVLDKGGRDDKSFNTSALVGAKKAVEELGVELKDVESPDDASYEPALRSLADRGMNLIIAIGFVQADAVKKVAPSYPNTKFAIVDAEVDAPNVASIMFSEHEGSYVVGYLAGLATKSNVIGFVGGMDIALIRRFQLGYEAGAKAANSKIKVLTNYAGITGDAWVNPPKGKELALSQAAQKADVVFHAAGATGMGVFDAAEEKGFLAIGVDSNQNWVKPGKILTSMLKRVDVSVFETIKSAKEGQFQPGTRYFNLKDQGVDYAVDEHNKNLIEPYKSKVDEVKSKIISGEISVPDYYKLNSKK